MLSATNLVFSTMFGTVLPAIIQCEAFQYLVGILIFGFICSFIIRFFRRK